MMRKEVQCDICDQRDPHLAKFPIMHVAMSFSYCQQTTKNLLDSSANADHRTQFEWIFLS